MDNLNLNENTMNKLKDMLNKGDFSDTLSKISPEMIQNFSNMVNTSNTSSNSSENTQDENTQPTDSNDSRSPDNSNSSNGFDFSNIDMNTMLKIQSVLGKLNNSKDSRSNLLYSLKPYLRDERKEKIDQYAQLLNVAKMADLFNNNPKEKKNE